MPNGKGTGSPFAEGSQYARSSAPQPPMSPPLSPEKLALSKNLAPSGGSLPAEGSPSKLASTSQDLLPGPLPADVLHNCEARDTNVKFQTSDSEGSSTNTVIPPKAPIGAGQGENIPDIGWYAQCDQRSIEEIQEERNSIEHPDDDIYGSPDPSTDVAELRLPVLRDESKGNDIATSSQDNQFVTWDHESLGRPKGTGYSINAQDGLRREVQQNTPDDQIPKLLTALKHRSVRNTRLLGQIARLLVILKHRPGQNTCLLNQVASLLADKTELRAYILDRVARWDAERTKLEQAVENAENTKLQEVTKNDRLLAENTKLAEKATEKDKEIIGMQERLDYYLDQIDDLLAENTKLAEKAAVKDKMIKALQENSNL